MHTLPIPGYNPRNYIVYAYHSINVTVAQSDGMVEQVSYHRSRAQP